MGRIYSLLLLGVILGVWGTAARSASGHSTARQTPADSVNYRLFSNERPPLLPMPREVVWGEEALEIKEAKVILPGKTSYPKQMELIRQEMKLFFEDHAIKAGDGYTLRFELSHAEELKADPESYQLASSKKGVSIKASSTKGLFYGWKTLQQLIIRRDGKTTIPVVQIKDAPKFPIRGFMNDTGRNYMDISLIKEEIDSMAQYKLNVYHFHFTDNYGWRLESRKYPQLQNPASFERKPGKYYTQKEFVEFVEYCRLRNIMVIPEMDMPGHTKSFRKALGIEKMDDPKVTKILTDLIKELASLVPAEKMPYIHIGTDEAHGNEVVSKETLRQYFEAVASTGRRAIRWQPGLNPGDDMNPIQHLWTGRQRSRPSEGAEYIDSLENYLNHLDPFESIMTMYFKKNCIAPGAKGLGGILCSWPDLYIEDERAHLSQTPVFSSMAAYSESVWSDLREEDDLIYYSNLPLQGSVELEGFREFENRLLAHRDRFFRNKEFSYVRQSNIPWKLIGPFPNNNEGSTSFPVENSLRDSYEVEGRTYKWSSESYTGATLIFKHYCDYPTLVSPEMGKMSNPRGTYYAMTYVHSPRSQEVDFWIGGHHWPNSDFRDGAMGVPGKWFHADPQFYVNDKAIAAPEWKHPNRNKADALLPLVDENYIFRKPTKVKLKKGWNKLLVKSPHNNSARRWMFTFVPVSYDYRKPGCNIKEVPGLVFAVGLKDGIPMPVKEEKKPE